MHSQYSMHIDGYRTAHPKIKPPIDTITAIAMIRGAKIFFIETSSICGFFSGSAIVDDAGEEPVFRPLKRSSIAMMVEVVGRRQGGLRSYYHLQTWGLRPPYKTPIPLHHRSLPNAVIPLAPKKRRHRYHGSSFRRAMWSSTSYWR